MTAVGATDGRIAALTPQQRAAVESAGSVVVRAGAGSGKTAVLVARYVRLVCGDTATDARRAEDAAPPVPLDVAQVLAVTFTEKAAAEMRARIRAALAARIADAVDGDRARLLRTQRALASARIGTIHALAASLLRAAPLESGTRPDATVLDEIDGPAYVEREVRRILLARLRDGDDDVRLCADAWGFGSNDSAGLVSVVCDVLAETARRGVALATLVAALERQRVAAAGATSALRDDTARLIALVEGWLGGVAGTRRPTAAAVAAMTTFRERWPQWRARLAGLHVADDVAALLALRDFPSAASRVFRQRPEWRLCADLLTLKPQDGTPRFGGTIAAAFGCARALPLAEACTRVVIAVDAALSASKRRDGVLTFDDLISGARRLLAEHGAAARIVGDVRAVLVDEFQDTDPAQVDLVRRVAAGGAELFVVGDEKQSIYRFRGAEVQLFAAMRSELGRELSLTDNFRSRPPLLAFVNGLAARLFAPRADDPPWRVRWSAAQALGACRPSADEDETAGPDGTRSTPARRPLVRVVSLVNQIGAGDSDMLAAPARALEGRVVAATITDLLAAGRWRPGDVAVLLPALTQVKAYEFALRRWAIPYEVVRGRGFYQCQEVRDLMHLLSAVADPDDGVALAGVLRSPLFGLSDATLERLAAPPATLTWRFTSDEPFGDLEDAESSRAGAARDLLRDLRLAHARVPVSELLARVVDATRLEAVLLGQFHGLQKVANVRKLIACARVLEEDRFVGAAEFVARARRFLDGESREPEAPRLGSDVDAVQVMTVHQAKGLEFPVVIVADLGREAPRDYRSPVLVDAEHGLLATATFGAGRHRLPHRLIEAWRRDDQDRADAERARLLYVACTRARDVLILSEGKGRRAALTADAGESGAERDRTWCEQIWSFLGRDMMATFVAGSVERTVVEVRGQGADGVVIPVAVEIEKSTALLTRVAPPARDDGAERVARALEETPNADDAAAVARLVAARRGTPGALVLSPTALADWERCPRQFWYRHVRGVPETSGERAARGGGGEAASMPGASAGVAVRRGLAAHAALEVLDFAVAADARAEAVARALAGARDLDAAARAEVAGDLVAALARMAAEDADLCVHGREMPFCLPVSGAPEIFVRGRIDLLGERRGRVLVRDYKYAAPTDDIDAYRVQLETYALAAATAYPDQPVDAEIAWLRAPGGRVTRAIDVAAARAAAQQRGARLAAALAARTASAFPLAFAAPSACRAIACAFVGRCFPARRAVEVAR